MTGSLPINKALKIAKYRTVQQLIIAAKKDSERILRRSESEYAKELLL